MLAKTIMDGLLAKKVTRILKKDDSIEAFSDEDHSTRRGFAELALKYRGEEPDKQTDGLQETYEHRIRRLMAVVAPSATPGKLPGVVDVKMLPEGQ